MKQSDLIFIELLDKLESNNKKPLSGLIQLNESGHPNPPTHISFDEFLKEAHQAIAKTCGIPREILYKGYSTTK